MPLRTTITLLLVALAAAGCAGFAAPRSETLARIAPMPLARLVPGRFVVELATPGLTGTFDAVAAVTDSSCRMQLFPDVGGKVLDLEVRAAAVVATFPGSRYEAAAPLDRAAPHVALVFAALLAELLAPVGPDRVLGERTGAGGVVEVALRPALGSGSVVATLDANGAIAACVIGLGATRFVLTADGRFTGEGFSGRINPPEPD